MRTLLIDGDILVVASGAVHEKEVDWGDDEWSLHVDLKEVKRDVLNTIERLKTDLDADDAVICLSIGTTFRHEIYGGYKAGRGRKPVGTAAVKQWLIDKHGAKVKPGIEADDIMGILATHPQLIKGEKIICSIDKDMLTIPGQLYRDGDIIDVTEGEARYSWLFQTLTGDTTDGYSGCPGVGAVGAKKILDTIDLSGPASDWWPHIVKVFTQKGISPDDALLQARLARILHHTDYDFKKKEPILWTPF
jgi:DNA polymerase-1